MKANRKIEEKIAYHDCALQKVKQLDQFENHEYQLSQSLKYKHKDLSSIPRADVKEKRMVFNVCMKGNPMLPDVPSSLTVAPQAQQKPNYTEQYNMCSRLSYLFLPLKTVSYFFLSWTTFFIILETSPSQPWLC